MTQPTTDGSGHVDRAEAWWRIALGIAQMVAATATLGAWVARAPSLIVIILVLVTASLILLSRVLWKGT